MDQLHGLARARPGVLFYEGLSRRHLRSRFLLALPITVSEIFIPCVGSGVSGVYIYFFYLVYQDHQEGAYWGQYFLFTNQGEEVMKPVRVLSMNILDLMLPSRLDYRYYSLSNTITLFRFPLIHRLGNVVFDRW